MILFSQEQPDGDYVEILAYYQPNHYKTLRKSMETYRYKFGTIN